jgi:hypothetical protein
LKTVNFGHGENMNDKMNAIGISKSCGHCGAASVGVVSVEVQSRNEEGHVELARKAPTI